MTITATDTRTPEKRARDEQLAQHMADVRTGLGRYEPLPAPLELVGPIFKALYTLFDLRERADEHAYLLEHVEYVEITPDEWAAAEAVLALMHRVVDFISGEVTGWAAADDPNPAPAMREALSTMLNIDRLARALTWMDRERLNGSEPRTWAARSLDAEVLS